ncbi:8-oxoguanine DNA glycosylase OGG fold protein [Streptomyces cellostaticus]|uniref:8-oxoguanine DNA glycosylase OGG fold protein n=1 Tax=Streptomyces cellostaticus TaxID=67285 RepID=UPI0025401B67
MIQSRVHVSDLREHVGRTVTVCGWVNTLRLQSKMQFVVVRDGTGMVQVTHKRDNGPLEARLQALTPASAVNHPCAILDSRVADTLRSTCQWDSLGSGEWPASTYARYCALLQRWAQEENRQLGRRIGADEIERWLFGT